MEKADGLSAFWGRIKDVKKPTQQIMKEIDQGESD